MTTIPHHTGGFFPYERAVLDLLDAGTGPAAIVRETGFSEAKVRRVINRFARTTASDKWEAKMRADSKRLLRRIRAVHPEYAE